MANWVYIYPSESSLNRATGIHYCMYERVNKLLNRVNMLLNRVLTDAYEVPCIHKRMHSNSSEELSTGVRKGSVEMKTTSPVHFASQAVSYNGEQPQQGGGGVLFLTEGKKNPGVCVCNRGYLGL